jgi:predicted esterase
VKDEQFTIYPKGPYRLNFTERRPKNPKRIILLLHGYSETGDKIFNRLIEELPQDAWVLAPDGLFPLPKKFPLQQSEKGEDLLSGYAWYFYHLKTDTFLIDYDVPAQTLTQALAELNTENLPITVIGYSQGGYLTIFLPYYDKNIDHIIAINCSFRHSHLKEELKVKVDCLHGEADIIVDPIMAEKRFNEMSAKGLKGEFQLLSDETHRLSASMAKKIGVVLQK